LNGRFHLHQQEAHQHQKPGPVYIEGSDQIHEQTIMKHDIPLQLESDNKKKA